MDEARFAMLMGKRKAVEGRPPTKPDKEKPMRTFSDKEREKGVCFSLRQRRISLRTAEWYLYS
jgi:hypothetical protein